MLLRKQSRSLPQFSTITVLFLVLLTACGGSSSVVGKWQHLPNPTPTPLPTPTSTGDLLQDMLGGISGGLSTSCDILYPNSIEFFKDGTYAGQLGSLWGGGNYEVVENGRIKLDTMQGGLSAYGFSLSGSILSFTDDSGCEFRYQRIQQ